MPKELDFDCQDGSCTWRWNPDDYPADRLTLRVRRQDGQVELREVPNTGRIVLPDDQQVEEIVSTGAGGRTRASRWRGPG